MENNQIVSGEAIPNITDSQNLEKSFLLYLASELCPTATEEKSEKKRLEILHLRLKRLTKLFSVLNNYPWGKNETEIRKACGQYLVSMNESRANRLQLNEMLYQQALVINELVSFRDLINNVLVTYNARVEKLGKIIAKK